jgi:hypothetical protein
MKRFRTSALVYGVIVVSAVAVALVSGWYTLLDSKPMTLRVAVRGKGATSIH